MLFGAHVSSSGGVWNAPKNAADIGCEVLQMFSRPPQGGQPKPITLEISEMFRKAMKNHGVTESYIHAPYIINLASGTARVRNSSISIVREELERGNALGCKAMMFHPGSAKDVKQKDAEKLVIEGLNQVMDEYAGSCQLLLEISAGAGMVMGDSFEEIALFIEGTERGKEIGVCFDTQHAFASGYDVRTKDVIDRMITEFDRTIGLEKLVLSHANDSKTELGSHKDRHEHLGDGLIGLEAFKLIVQHPKLQKLDLILETPIDAKRQHELELLKSFRKSV